MAPLSSKICLQKKWLKDEASKALLGYEVKEDYRLREIGEEHRTEDETLSKKIYWHQDSFQSQCPYCRQSAETLKGEHGIRATTLRKIPGHDGYAGIHSALGDLRALRSGAQLPSWTSRKGLGAVPVCAK